MLRAFARQVADVARDLGVVRDPKLDERKSRIIESPGAAGAASAVSIDLLNLLHAVDWKPVERARVVELLQPRTLGSAGWLGRVDVVRTMLAAGVDPSAAEEDGITPIDRTICAWVTSDLHVACVEAMLDAGAVPQMSHSASLRCEAVGDPAGIAIADLLARRATTPELRDHFQGIADVFREDPLPGIPLD